VTEHLHPPWVHYVVESRDGVSYVIDLEQDMRSSGVTGFIHVYTQPDKNMDSGFGGSYYLGAGATPGDAVYNGMTHSIGGMPGSPSITRLVDGPAIPGDRMERHYRVKDDEEMSTAFERAEDILQAARDAAEGEDDTMTHSEGSGPAWDTKPF
jgi:hypothetical protein